MSIDGVSLQASPFVASYFLFGDQPLSQFERKPVELVIPGDYSFPEVARSQPTSGYATIVLDLISIETTILYAVRRLFDRYKGEVPLVLRDGDGLDWTTQVRIQDLQEHNANRFKALVYIKRPIFDRTATSSDGPRAITASPTSFDLTVGGCVRTYPTFVMTPTVAKTAANDYRFRVREIIAWRSELEGEDSLGAGYPIDIANDAFDTATEIAAGRMQADGDDLRPFVDGIEFPRRLDGINTDSTKVWVPIHFSPGKSVAMAVAASGVLPVTGGSWAINDPLNDSLEDWPAQGVFRIDNEAVWYGRRTDTEFQLIERDYWNTAAAAHTAGTVARWVEHDIQICYGNSALTVPPLPNFAIDLPLSSNLLHTYTSTFTHVGTQRYGQMLPRFTEDNIKSVELSVGESSALWFIDKKPGAIALYPFNNVELYVPCGVKVGSGTIAHTVSGGDFSSLVPGSDLALDLRLFGTDIATGIEKLLARYKKTDRTGAKTLDPDTVLQRLRFNVIYNVITGAYGPDTGGSSHGAVALTANGIDGAARVGQTFTLDQDVDMFNFAWFATENAGADTRIGEARIHFMRSDAYADWLNQSGSLIMPNAGFTTTRKWVPSAALVPEPVELHSGRHIFLVTAGTAGAGTLSVTDRLAAGSRGERWNEAALGVWTTEYHKDLLFLIIGDGSVVQPEAPTGMEGYASFDTIQITFDDTTPRTPSFMQTAREDIYPIRGRIEHVDQGFYIDVFYLAALTETLTIRTKTKEVFANETRKQFYPGAITPSDPEQWFYLRGTDVAADNTVRWTETGVGGGSSLNLTTTWNDQWA